MSVLVIVGAQWGDEGKGKIVDLLAENSRYIVRYAGGDNAGHTVVNPHGEFKLHLIPSGIFSEGATCVIGNGVVVNPGVLLHEIADLEKRGVDTSRLYVSDRANLIMPYHLLLDGLEEESRGGAAIGTTRKGIGPAYADKTARLGIRVGDLQDADNFRKRLVEILEIKNRVLTRIYDKDPLPLDDILQTYLEYGRRLAPRITDTVSMLSEAINGGEAVLLEGAQGTLLDPDFGTYPFTTSSSPLVSNACLGAGIGPTRVDHALGIFKAYCTRVGGGPFPTELNDEIGDKIREQAHEYGTTTGRARRCGWFDGVVARYSTAVNGFTSAAITRLDVLDILPRLQICTAYLIEGRITDKFPATITELEKCEPVLEEMPGWLTPTTGIRTFEDLPEKARAYVERLESLMGCPASIISVGEHRKQTIIRRPVP